MVTVPTIIFYFWLNTFIPVLNTNTHLYLLTGGGT